MLETINMEKRQSLTMIFDSILLIFLSHTQNAVVDLANTKKAD